MIFTSVVGLAALEARLHKLDIALDSEEILDEAEAMLLNRIRTRFLNEVDADGQAWKPSVAGMKRRGAGGTGTLFDTGTLFHSIQAFSAGPNARDIGTDVPYGKYHQLGLGHNPLRAFLGFSDEDLFLTEKLVTLRISEALK